MNKLIKVILFSGLLTACSFAQWSQLTSFPSVYTRDIFISNGVLYVSTGGSGVYKSTDEGNSWQTINNGLTPSQAKDTYQVIDVSGNLFVATTDGIYKSTDGGDSWVKKSNGITIGPGALYEFTESIFEYNGSLFTGAWNGLYSSADGAENWMITNVSGEGIGAKNFTEHDGILFAARESINDPIGYKSTDSGVAWQDLTGISLPTITFFSEPPILWAGTIAGVWLSTDDGLTWQIRNNGLTSDPYSSSIIRINGVLITSLKFGGSGVYRSLDDGLNWEAIGEGLPFLNSIEDLFVLNNKILAATSDGIWQRDVSEVPVELSSFIANVKGNAVMLNWITATETNNKGFEIQKSTVSSQRSVPVKWEKIGFVTGFGTTTEPKSYSFTDNKVSPGTYSYRLKQINFDGSFEYSSNVNVVVNIPIEFSLSQNYPNPFNPSTIINYSLNNPGLITLKIFDSIGKEVATLVNEKQSAGDHSVIFNAYNGKTRLASGIYFYKLKSGESTAIKKFILMK